MKKITLLLFAMVILCFGFSANAQCDYTLEMNDSFGDGWNGNTIDVLVNGVTVLDDVTFDETEGTPVGEQFIIAFAVTDGDQITTLWNGGGTFGGETSYRILSANSIAVGSGAQASITTDITVSCAVCTPPAGAIGVVSNDDCVAQTFDFDVDITNLGGATSVTITNTAGLPPTSVTATGIVTLVGFPTDTVFDITFVDDEDSGCDVTIAGLIFLCPPANDLCADAIPLACDETVFGDTSDPTVTNTVGNASADLWYSYSGAAGDITASLCDSSYDTNIRIFDSCGGIEITNNDDSCGTRSVATFVADGMSTYYIAVEGYATTEGAFTLTITCAAPTPPPANDLCGDAIALTLTVAENGTTVGAVENVANEKPSCDGFGTIADVWYTVTLPTGTNTLNVITTVSGGDSSEANLAIYSNDCTILEVNQLACDDTGGFSGETLTIGGTAGTTYLIRVWSDGVAPAPPSGGRIEGTFTIVADATLSVDSLQNENAFTYFPNPVKNELTLNAQKDIQNVSIFNLLGQEVLRTAPNATGSTINMNELSQGAYFVQVTIGNVIETVRVIKQ
ncbi:T9SS type A sorting domain-containing protein [Psychroserpens burtonensis]|uniref:T9SS type A sorting domain-containing protein n=1 Tax=Psychroserpens burtonensis TaxID=49278 RepID=A0A5C7BB62_9FLAO|nr:T9SS type A sorting domain-containing protein [Psychroserpens burtonensis]TXE17453.1 T9SS type A sorting domain-containing protein [Psychroserpens burtonensis]